MQKSSLMHLKIQLTIINNAEFPPFQPRGEMMGCGKIHIAQYMAQ
jgi:hypothetical protein